MSDCESAAAASTQTAAGVIIIVEASNYGSKSGLECSHNTQPGENKSTRIQTIIVINP